MAIADDLACRIAVRSAQPAGRFRLPPPPGGRAIQCQAHEATPLESLVALGAVQHRSQRGAGGSRTQAFGEVAQGIIAKDSADPQGSSRRRPHPGLDGPKGVLPQNEADQDGPQQGGRRDLRARTAIAGGAEVSGQAQTPGGVFPQSPRRRTLHRGFLFFRCWRAKTKSRALAASTSRTAS